MNVVGAGRWLIITYWAGEPRRDRAQALRYVGTLRIKRRGTMGKVLAGSLAILAVMSSGLLLTAVPEDPAGSALPISPSSTSSTMLIWEAYSRGLITISQVDVTYTIGGQTDTAALGYEVSSTSTGDVAVTEYVMLLSPNPADTFDADLTTQDGILSDATIPAGSSETYGYGDFVARGILSMPPWWCTEERQFVHADVPVFLGGEIAPFGMESFLGDAQGGPGGTQDQVWAYLREHASPVVGKTVNGAFWGEIPETAGQALDVVLRATNLAISDEGDSLPAPDAPTARVSDRIPAGYDLDTGSISPAGYSLTSNGDGSTTIFWVANLPAADVTNKPPNDQPTPYVTRTFSYTMTTPHITPSRVGLPRAAVSVGDDAMPEAVSEQPLMDVFRVPLPPVPNAGPGYVGVEGDTITFSAGASSDPNGDPMQFRWDFTSDGIWDTAWSSDPSAASTFGDDLSAQARVEVSDGEFTATADAPLTISNIAPSISVSILVCQDQDRDDDDDDDDDESGREGDYDGDDEGDGGADEGCGGGRVGDDDHEGTRGTVFVFTAVATDPGSDDLTFTWSGDCTGYSSPVTYPNEPAVVPDPDPSPDENPRNVTDVQRVVCGGDTGGDDDDDDDGRGDDDADDEGGRDRDVGDDGDDEDDDREGGQARSFGWQLSVEDDDGGVTILTGTVVVEQAPDDDDGGDGGDDDDGRDGDEDEGDHDGGDGGDGDDDVGEGDGGRGRSRGVRARRWGSLA